ncbi:MAG: universal stress protein [Gammaproteobacteria bacterium]
MKTILATTDFSDSGRDAAGRAAMLAAQTRADLAVLHVMNGPSLESLYDFFASPAEAEDRLMEEPRRLLEDLAEAIHRERGVAASVRVRLGRVVDEIVAEAESADLLVLGARGTSPLRELLLGSTADRALRKRRQPTLIVKRPADTPYRRVLVPVDFSPGSVQSLRLALRVAPDADCTVFHAYDIPFEGSLRLAGVSAERLAEHRERARLDALHAMAELIRQAGADPQRFAPHAKSGEASLLILGEAADSDADLIVMGKRDRTRLEELLLGSTTAHVLAGAHCDVLIT